MTSVVPQNSHKKTPGFSPCHISRRLWSLFRPFQCLASSFLPNPNATSFKCDCPVRARDLSVSPLPKIPLRGSTIVKVGGPPSSHPDRLNGDTPSLRPSTRWKISPYPKHNKQVTAIKSANSKYCKSCIINN